MKISCGIEHERLALGFDDVRFIYIKGSSYPDFDPAEQFFMNFGVIWQYKMVCRPLFPWF